MIQFGVTTPGKDWAIACGLCPVWDHLGNPLRAHWEFVHSLFARRVFYNQTRKLGYELELCLEHLSPNKYMSDLHRYDLLSRQLVKMRGNTPVHLWPN